MKDPIIISALIQGISAIIATGIAGMAASKIGKKFQDQEKLKEKLNLAQNDIEFLLAVERKHCEKNKNKNKIRKIVKEEQGLEWSGKFTPGRVRNP